MPQLRHSAFSPANGGNVGPSVSVTGRGAFPGGCVSGTCPEVLINVAKPENPFRKVEKAEIVHFPGRDVAMVMPGLLRRVIDMVEVRVFAGRPEIKVAARRIVGPQRGKTQQIRTHMLVELQKIAHDAFPIRVVVVEVDAAVVPA